MHFKIWQEKNEMPTKLRWPNNKALRKTNCRGIDEDRELNGDGIWTRCALLVNVLHDISRPGQSDLQLTSMLHKEIHQRPGDRCWCVEEKCWYPQDGSIQLLQTQKEVVPVLYRQQIVVVFFQDTGVEGCHVGASSNVLLEDLSWGKVAPEDKVKPIDLLTAAWAGQDAAVADHSTDIVVLLEDGWRLGKERAEILPDGEDVLVTGVVVMHQLPDSHWISGQREITGDVNVLRDLLSARQVGHAVGTVEPIGQNLLQRHKRVSQWGFDLSTNTCRYATMSYSS